MPFASRADAISYFGGDTTWAQAWADGLERREDGSWPSFKTDVMLAVLEESSRKSYWKEWARIRCPVLIVRAAGNDSTGSYARMVESLPTAHLIEVEGAGHDLHLDQPRRWREVLEGFLATLDR